METGIVLDSYGTFDLHSCSVRKGVIWLFLATVAEVTPAVSPINISVRLLAHSNEMS